MSEQEQTAASALPWEPPAPQLIRNARMMIIAYAADKEAIAQVLPPGLQASPNGIVQMNMYEVGEGQTSGFGPFSLTYLTVEVEGRDSDLANGVMQIPGRYFVHYWNSSPRVRNYVREKVGAKAMPGARRIETQGDNQVSILQVEGRDVIRATVRATERPAGTLGGHLNYYARRSVPKADGNGYALDELIEFPLPFVADAYEASVERIEFDFPEGHPAQRLKPLDASKASGVLYADVTFTYSMGRVIGQLG